MKHDRNDNLLLLARNLRKNMTKEERHLWYDFPNDYPIRFRRQEIAESYILDFYCDKARLAVEIDGAQHYEDEEKLEYDNKRTERLREIGIDIIRFPNGDINKSFESVCRIISEAVNYRIENPEAFFPEWER